VNESIETLFEHDDCPGRLCLVRQIAGAFASRVVTTVRPGQRFPTGHKIGMIKFGSRTELYLSDPRALVLVRPADVVRGGASVLAHNPAPGEDPE
jgi:phosphatidylserine decarboxylase